MFLPKEKKDAEAKFATAKTTLKKLKEELINFGDIPATSEVYKTLPRFLTLMKKYSAVQINIPNTRKNLKNPNFNAAQSACEATNRRMKNYSELNMDNLMFGDCFGLWTFPASKWEKTESVYNGFVNYWIVEKDRESFAAKHGGYHPLDREVIAWYKVEPYIRRNLEAALNDINTILSF